MGLQFEHLFKIYLQLYIPIGGGGIAGTSKSGGSAGRSDILGGPLLLILVEKGRIGLPTPGAVFA